MDDITLWISVALVVLVVAVIVVLVLVRGVRRGRPAADARHEQVGLDESALGDRSDIMHRSRRGF